MLKYERTDKGEHLEMNGSIVEIVAEVTYLIRLVHKKILEETKDGAAEYQKLMMRTVGNADSPVWLDTDALRNKLADKLKEVLDLLRPESKE